MAIGLVALQFYDPSATALTGLPLRRDSSSLVPLPEWQLGVTQNPLQSPVAYCMEDVAGKPIAITGWFASAQPESPTVEIRGVASPDNPLGDVTRATVAFDPNGRSQPIALQLETANIQAVGREVIQWRWESRAAPDQPWVPFAISAHVLYVLLGTPTLPWVQGPFAANNVQLPWTTILDVACTWASGTTNPDEASARITAAVFALGGSLFAYDCEGGGASHYTSPGMNDFHAAAFLERLSGGVGFGARVNCTDCSVFVSTLVNALGCDLSQSRMGMAAPFFELNPILAIGSNTVQPACGWPGFFYHEVAWTGACGASDRIYDACLEFNGSDDPTGPPFEPLLPAGIVFGSPGSEQYVDRLASPPGRPKCVAQPSMRRRRNIASEVAAPDTDMSPELIARVKERHGFDRWAGQRRSRTGLLFWDFLFGGQEFANWRPMRQQIQVTAPSTSAAREQATAPAPHRAIQTLWSRQAADAELLRVDSYELESVEDAHEFLVRILADFESPEVEQVDPGSANRVGDVAFGTPAASMRLFARANHVHLVRSAGRKAVPVSDAARQLDALLTAVPSPDLRRETANVVARVGRELPLSLGGLPPPPAGTWYKLIASEGAIAHKRGQLMYRAETAGFHDIDVYVVNPSARNRAASAFRLRVAAGRGLP